MTRFVLFAIMIGIGTISAAQDPARPIRMIVPFPAGGGVDILGRATAQRLTEALNQQVIVDNRGGASGNIGAHLAAQATPDGNTLLFSSATLPISSVLYPKLPFELRRDLVPLTQVATAPHVLSVHPSLPVKSVKDLVALAKKKPGALNYASQSIGSTSHLAAELFKSVAGINIVHVPYRGAAPALTALVSGEISMLFPVPFTVIPHIKSGRVRALAVTSAKRAGVFPDLPTMAENGLKGVEASQWWGVWAPAGTPRGVVARLSAEIAKGSRSPEARERFATEGADPVGNRSEEFSQFIDAEIERWGKVIRTAGIKPE